MEQKVSIVVPVYNVEKYLKRCVDSLIGQSYPNIEVLLVDDGSKDSSLSICKEYELKDSRIRVFHKENEGLGLTRNFGIEKATGEYITFVDSDDYLTPDAIAVMLKPATATDADVVIANMFYKDEEMKVAVAEHLYTGADIKSVIINRMMGNYAKKEDALSYTATAKLFKKKLFTEDTITEFLNSEKFHRQLEQLSHYKNAKQMLKKGSGIEKLKSTVQIPGNRFFWRDIVEKTTLLLREHI